MAEIIKRDVTFTSMSGGSWTGDLVKSRYRKGDRTALSLENGEEIILVATINMPEEHLEENEVFIKDHAENEGLLKQLVDQGIVSLPVGHVRSHYVTIPKVKLLI